MEDGYNGGANEQLPRTRAEQRPAFLSPQPGPPGTGESLGRSSGIIESIPFVGVSPPQPPPPPPAMLPTQQVSRPASRPPRQCRFQHTKLWPHHRPAGHHPDKGDPALGTTLCAPCSDRSPSTGACRAPPSAENGGAPGRGSRQSATAGSSPSSRGGGRPIPGAGRCRQPGLKGVARERGGAATRPRGAQRRGLEWPSPPGVSSPPLRCAFRFLCTPGLWGTEGARLPSSRPLCPREGSRCARRCPSCRPNSAGLTPGGGRALLAPVWTSPCQLLTP